MSTGGVIAWGDDTYGQSSPPPETADGITAVGAGEKHSLALTDAGEVLAWGDDTLGQATVPTGAQSGVTAIACGWNHSLALKTDGTVVAWGDNGLGQATVPAEAVGVSAIGAGGNHSVALLSGGGVIAWGDVGEHKAEIKPVAGAGIRSGKAGVPYSASHDAVRIAVGDYQATVVRNDGLLFAWKYLDDAKLPPPPVTGTIAAMASGGKQTLALIGGAVSAWEWDQPSRLTVVTAPTYPVPVDAQSGVVQVAAGGEHALALKDDGSVVAWGSDSHGQVALPSSVMQDVIGVVGGWLHSLAIGVVAVSGESLIITVRIASGGSFTWPHRSGGVYDADFDWGDGTVEHYTSAPPAHSYASAGDYDVKVTGTCPAPRFIGYSSERNKLIDVKQWGKLVGALDWSWSFARCENFNASATDDFGENVTSLYAMFYFSKLFDFSIENWITSSVTNMRYMFFGASSFNKPLNALDTSSVASMESMFEGATLFNQPLNNWDTSSVTDMDWMFADAESFNQDLSSWCVTNISSKPSGFDSDCPILSSYLPVWGTCP